MTPNEQRHVLNAITTAIRTAGFKEHRIKVREPNGEGRRDFQILGAHPPFEKERLEVLFVLSKPSYIWLISDKKEGLCDSYFAVHITKDGYEGFLSSLSYDSRLAWTAALTHSHTIWKTDSNRGELRYRVRESLIPYSHLYPDLTAKVMDFASPERLKGWQVRQLLRQQEEQDTMTKN